MPFFIKIDKSVWNVLHEVVAVLLLDGSGFFGLMEAIADEDRF